MHPVVPENGFLNALPNFSRNLFCITGSRTWKNGYYFFSSVACQKVRFTQTEFYALCNLLQTPVSSLMAIRIVDGFEIIHIYQDEGERLLIALVAPQTFTNLQIIRATVGNTH